MLWSIANVSTWTFTGYNMIIFYAALRAIPAELYEAAAVDGAGAFRTAMHIKLPLLRPAILLCTIFSVIGSFQLFAEPRVFYDIAPQVIGKSYTPNLYVYNLAFADQRLNYAAALSFLLGLVVFIVSFVVMRISAVRRPAHERSRRRAGRRRPHQAGERARRSAQHKPGASGGFVVPDALHARVPRVLPDAAVLAAWWPRRSRWTTCSSSFGLWFADFNLIDNIKDTFKQDNGVYVDWLRNTIMYSVVSAVGAALLAAAAGYGFAKFAFRGKNLMFWFVLGSVMVPTTALAIPTYLMFAKLGFTNNPLSVILPSLVSPFGIYLMRIYAEASVPTDLIEAARIDGAGEFLIFRKIAFRLLAPGFVTVLLFNFVATWNNYFLPLVMLSEPRWYPLTVGLQQWNSQATAGGGATSAFNIVITGSLISIVPLIIAFIFLQRYWQSGLGSGGVKG